MFVFDGVNFKNKNEAKSFAHLKLRGDLGKKRVSLQECVSARQWWHMLLINVTFPYILSLVYPSFSLLDPSTLLAQKFAHRYHSFLLS